MSAVRPIRIYRAICTAAGLRLKDKRVADKLASLIPKPVKLSDGRINQAFLPHIAEAVVDAFPGSKPDAAEIIRVLNERSLVGVVEDLGNVYKAVLREREVLGRVVTSQREIRQVNKRLMTLTNLVRGLDFNIESNIRVATNCIREALGYSGVRVYSLNLKEKTWGHVLVTCPPYFLILGDMYLIRVPMFSLLNFAFAAFLGFIHHLPFTIFCF